MSELQESAPFVDAEYVVRIEAASGVTFEVEGIVVEKAREIVANMPKWRETDPDELRQMAEASKAFTDKREAIELTAALFVAGMLARDGRVEDEASLQALAYEQNYRGVASVQSVIRANIKNTWLATGQGRPPLTVTPSGVALFCAYADRLPEYYFAIAERKFVNNTPDSTTAQILACLQFQHNRAAEQGGALSVYVDSKELAKRFELTEGSIAAYKRLLVLDGLIEGRNGKLTITETGSEYLADLQALFSTDLLQAASVEGMPPRRVQLLGAIATVNTEINDLFRVLYQAGKVSQLREVSPLDDDFPTEDLSAKHEQLLAYRDVLKKTAASLAVQKAANGQTPGELIPLHLPPEVRERLLKQAS